MSELLSGTVFFRNRDYPILWNGEFAQHIADKYIKERTRHPFLHVKIQKLLQKSKKFLIIKRLTTFAIIDVDDRIFGIMFYIYKSKAVIKSAHYMDESKQKRLGVGKLSTKKEKTIWDISDRDFEELNSVEPGIDRFLIGQALAYSSGLTDVKPKGYFEN